MAILYKNKCLVNKNYLHTPWQNAPGRVYKKGRGINSRGPEYKPKIKQFTGCDPWGCNPFTPSDSFLAATGRVPWLDRCSLQRYQADKNLIGLLCNSKRVLHVTPRISTLYHVYSIDPFTSAGLAAGILTPLAIIRRFDIQRNTQRRWYLPQHLKSLYGICVLQNHLILPLMLLSALPERWISWSVKITVIGSEETFDTFPLLSLYFTRNV